MAGGRQLTVTLVANTKSFSKGMMDSFRAAEGFKGKMAALGSSLSMMAGPAFLAAGAAAGAFALKLGIDGVKAAIDEQKELAVLKQTLDNVGQGFAMDSVNKFIDDLRFATGVSDSELRPALAKIIGVTKDAASAQKLLAAAVDASVGSGKDLSSVSQAIAKAAAGSTTSLKKLIPELDATKLKSGGLEAVLAAVEDRFGGSAAAAAGTFAGQLQRLQDGVNELQESFGKGFLDSLGGSKQGFDDLAQALRDSQPQVESIGRSLGTIADSLIRLGPLIATVTDLLSVSIQAQSNFFQLVSRPWTWLYQNLPWVADATNDNADAASNAANAAGSLGREFANTSKAAQILTSEYDNQAPAVVTVSEETVRYTDALDSVKEEARAARTRLLLLTGAFNLAEEAMARREAMQSYKDSLKEFIADPSADTRDAVVANMITASESIADPGDAAKFTAKEITNIIDAAKAAGVSVPQWMLNIQTAATDAGVPVNKLKQDLYDIPNNIPVNIDVQLNLPSRSLVDSNGNGIPDALEIATGGPVFGAGGYVGARMGTHASDSIRARLSRGEYVLNADAVKRLGVGTLNSLNNGGSMGGGLTINGDITVQSAPGERAEDSVPRALRRMAFVAGLNG